MDKEALEDLFRPLGHITTKRMFGGLAVYLDGLCFSIVINGEVHLKTDTETAEIFREAGSRPFIYETKDRAVTVNYWLLPESAFDDEDELKHWSRMALETARKAAAKKPKPKPIKAKNATVDE